MSDYPHVPVGKMYYRVGQTDISNHSGTRFETVTVSVGISKRYLNGDEVNIRMQADSGRSHWYGAKIETSADFFGMIENDPFELARKLRKKISEQRNTTQTECVMETLIAVLTAMRATHAVYDSRTSRIVAVKDVLPPDMHAWRDDWERRLEPSE